MDRTYNVDLNVTRECNFQCSYCFTDTKGEKVFTGYDNFKKFISKLLTSSFFKDNYELLCINFWGGEPTLEPAEIVNLMNDLQHYDNVRFFIFSNGYDLHGYLKDALLSYKDVKVGIHPKVCIQVSYDGAPIHNMYRRSFGKLTSKEVLDNIKWLDVNKIPYVIKSTIRPQAFKHMYDAYMDIKRLASELTATGFYKNVNYFPTIDYYSSEQYSKDEMNQYCEALETSLVRIAAEEAKTPQGNFFKWFEHSRAICATGQHMIAVDTNENIYVCHGCLYGDSKEKHLIGNINNDNIIEKLEELSKYFGENIDDEGECKECDVIFCLRCNHVKYENSKKTKYLEKWRDYTDQPNLCRFYKINSNVKKGLDLFRRNLEYGLRRTLQRMPSTPRI